MELASIDLSSPFTPSFHKFQQLPAELRTQIWRLAAPKPTVIERTMNNNTMSYALCRHALVPAVVQVCREARAELLYESENRHGARDDQFEVVYLSKEDRESGKGVYINCAKDTLLIYRAPQHAVMPDAANLASIQNLAMEWGLRPCWVQGHCHVGVQFIQQFPSLKTLTLLVNFKGFAESDLAPAQPGQKQREQKQKRRALGEIRTWVLDAVQEARDRNTQWTPPDVRVVQKTKHWRRRSFTPPPSTDDRHTAS